MYEVGGFIVNFFDRAKVERVWQKGMRSSALMNLRKVGLPRKLFRVTLRKN